MRSARVTCVIALLLWSSYIGRVQTLKAGGCEAHHDFNLTAFKIEQIPYPAVNFISYTISEQAFQNSIIGSGDYVIFRRFVEKFTRGDCIKIVVLGASVTCGRGESSHPDRPGGKEHAWPVWLTQLLNHHFPCCSNSDGKRLHNAINLCVTAVGSDYWIDTLSSSKYNKKSLLHQHLGDSDLVIVDTAVNDCIGCVSAYNLERHNVDESYTAEQTRVQVYTEILINILLRWGLTPLYLGVSSRMVCEPGENKPPWSRCLEWNGTRPRESDAVHNQHLVTSYYGVPYVSLLDGLGPFLTVKEQKWIKTMFKTDSIHVTTFGHNIIARLLFHFLVKQSSPYDALRPQGKDEWMLKAPMWAHQSQIDMHVKSDPLYVSTVLNDDATRRQVCVGFRAAEDVPGKPGLIGESLGDTVVLAFTPSEVSQHGHAGVLHVMSLKSFHPKMGTFNVSIFAAAAAAAEAATGTVTLGDTLLGSRPQDRVRNLEEHEATDRLCDFNTSSAGRHLPLLASKVIDSKWSQEISEISIDEITFPL